MRDEQHPSGAPRLRAAPWRPLWDGSKRWIVVIDDPSLVRMEMLPSRPIPSNGDRRPPDVPLSTWKRFQRLDYPTTQGQHQ